MVEPSIDPHDNCSTSSYIDGYNEDGTMRFICRALVCSRCNKCTGNNHQGHWWALCKNTKAVERFHFCCPGDCELENA